MNEFSDLEVAISVMAYPAISTRHGEVVCVAGFQSGEGLRPDWVRLFPFRVREMPEELRVRKWDLVKLRVKKSSDTRPESFMPNMDSLQKVGHISADRNWEGRRRLVDPHRGLTMADVVALHRSDGRSLAVVEPGRILDLEVSSRSKSELSAQAAKAKAWAAQGELFSLAERKPLEPIPFDFHFVVQYDDEKQPRRLKLIDWEVNEAFRKYRRLYSDPAERIRNRWLNDVCGPTRDPVFLVGNQHRFPDQWLLLGIVWPKLIGGESTVQDSLL